MALDSDTAARPCPACGHANEQAAARCSGCGAALTDAVTPVAPGATFNDPDDLAFPAEVRPLRTTPEAAAVLPPGATVTAPVPAPLYAGIVRRAAAFGIDLSILMLFSAPLAVAVFLATQVGLAINESRMPAATEDGLTSLLTWAWSVMALLYFTVLHAGSGQTIGKAMLRIRVRTTDLRPIGGVRSFIRALAYVLSGLVFGLGFLAAAVTPRRRAWHDYLARTCVVRLAPTEV